MQVYPKPPLSPLPSPVTIEEKSREEEFGDYLEDLLL